MAIYGANNNVQATSSVPNNPLGPTLVHEEIYVYIDPITEVTETQTASNSFTFVNNSLEEIADLGVFDIEVLSGSYSKVVITAGNNKTSTFNIALTTGNKMKLDFRNIHFLKGAELLYAEDIPYLADNSNSNITITLTGTGSANITRKYEKAQVNNSDLWFLESVSIDTNYERPKKILLTGQEKTLKGEKKVHSFSINGIWSQDEISKFTEKFRMRLVDEEARKLNTLANCVINSSGRSSSSGGDLTYAISGSCEKIF